MKGEAPKGFHPRPENVTSAFLVLFSAERELLKKAFKEGWVMDKKNGLES